MRLLNGAWYQRHVLHEVEDAVMRHVRFGEQPPDEGEALIRYLLPVFDAHTLDCEVVVEDAARSQAQNRPPP